MNIYFSFSLSALVLMLHARSHALADVFEKNEKKIKQCLTVQARFNYTAQSQDQIPDHSDQINYF